MIRTTLASLAVALALVFMPSARDPAAHLEAQSGGGPSSIRTENAKPGTLDWQLTNPGGTTGVIEGYASLTSVNRGGQIRLFVNTAEPAYEIDIFRMGHYGGLGGRRMMPTTSRAGRRQITPAPAPTTGLVECDWVDPFILNIPNTADPTDWMSGIYLVKLTASVSRRQQYIIFAVRDDARFTNLIMAQTVNNYQAYNPWGGKSLYGTIANRTDTQNKALKVSFNRPYYGEETNGASEFFFWEFPMIRWLEAEGYDISYATNVDVDRDPTLLISHRAFLSVGHDEYWSWRMRDHVEDARNRGVNLGFFSGNTSYWQVRLEPAVFNGEPGRTLVGYKEFWAQDPITPSNLKTNLFRLPPVNRPEDAMLGVMFITAARPVMTVEDASHWVFTGTGLHNGDRLTNTSGSSFLGYEVDAMGPGSPANTQRLAHSPVTPLGAYFSDMTVYRAASGATVFASGSIGWSQTVPAVQQITRNVLARFIAGAFAETTPVRPLLPAPLLAQDIGNVGRAGFVAASGVQSFTLNGAGRDLLRTDDAFFYAYQPLSGDGQITARLTGLQHYWDNRAGLMVRESLAANAKYVALVGRPSESRGLLLEGVELRTRDQIGVMPRLVAARDLPLPNWLRLTRSGSSFSASSSADGIQWTPLGTATVPMTGAVYIGTMVASAQFGVWATASFDNVSVSTGPPGGGGTCTTVTLDRSSFYSGAPESNWSIAVSTPIATCTWTATSDSPWLMVTSVTPNPPAGNGTVRVRALTNATGLFRIGRLTIGGVVYTVSQEATAAPPAPPPPTGGACSSIALNRSSYYSGGPESNWTVAVTAPTTTCTWTAVSDSGWLLVTNLTPNPPVGSGSVALRTLTNATGLFRVGRVTIGGVLHTVSQEPLSSPPVTPPSGGACPSVTLDRLSFYSGAPESNWTILVAAPTATCTWTAASESPWLVITRVTPNPPIGSGSVGVRALTNTTGQFRVGQFRIGGVVYRVSQEQ